MNKSLLVSFCIVTYNTSKFILETLECAKNQTYQNLELIVSDDCSTDNTLDLVRDWLVENKSRFVRTEIVTVSKNTGVAANKMRAEKACRGDYIKPIDGDDLIENTFIEKAVEILENNPEYSFLYTKTYYLMENDGRCIEEDTSNFRSGDVFKDLYIVNFWIKTTSWFFTRDVAQKTSYDTSQYLCEDFLRTLDISAQFKIYYLDEYLAYYRRHEDNMNANREWTRDGMFRYFESQLQAISHYSDYYLFGERRKWILDQLVDEAKCRNPFYLVKMFLNFRDFRFLNIFIDFEIKEVKYQVKKTSLFKYCRRSWIWRSLKGEL